MEQKNRSHGKIDQLPPGLRKEVEEKLLTGATYEEVSDWLKEQGEEVHLSSVGRYGKKFLNKFESVRLAKEFAKLLAEDNVDRPATELLWMIPWTPKTGQLRQKALPPCRGPRCPMRS